jgi:hypothetical protein
MAALYRTQVLRWPASTEELVTWLLHLMEGQREYEDLTGQPALLRGLTDLPQE